MNGLHKLSFWLLIIGGLNWLLLVLGWEVGGLLFGGMDATFSQILYVLIGLAAIFEIVYLLKK